MATVFSRRHFLGAALYGAVGGPLAACGGSDDWSGQDLTAPSGPVSDARVQFAVDKIDQMAATLMQRTGLPGMAIAVVRSDPTNPQTDARILYAKGFGVRDLKASGAVDADTVFQIASMSKSIGATVVAQQVGLGGISWNTPVQRELPWFRLSDPVAGQRVTIGDLYAHRSGLPGQAGDMLEMVGYDRDYVLRHMVDLPLKPLGTTYAYSNFGMTAGGVAVATAAGLEWADLSKQVLYQPLGMSRTSSRFSDFDALGNRAYGHIQERGKWKHSEVRHPDAQSPAGGVSSSVNDVARWMMMLLGQGRYQGQRVVDATALSAALTPQIQVAPGNYYGFGFALRSTASGRLAYNHSGAFAIGASTSFTVIPSAGLGIVVLTNGYPMGIPETLIQEFVDLVLFGTIQKDWWAEISPAFIELMAPGGSLVGVPPPASPRPAQAAAAYIGTYQNAYYGALQVQAGAGTDLLLTIGPDHWSMPLTHWDGDIFVWAPVTDQYSPDSRFKVTFAAGSVALELCEGEGWETFRR
jgi:CubicO group peptidase (beta-lactamase class C family)